MKIIGVTGGIGAGKSVVSRILRCKGYAVYDCDHEARGLMDASSEVVTAIGGFLGEHCLKEGGSLNRAAIAGEVFSDPDKLAWLNRLVHGLVREDLQRRVDILQAAGAKVLFVESAILHTSALDRSCDEIWLVEAPLPLRLERASARDNCSEEKIQERIEAQKKDFEDFDPEKLRVIDNDGSSSLLSQIDNLINL